MWLITLPGKARIFLRQLKNLALLEFIPYHLIFGKDEKEEEKSAADEQNGIERFGSNHLVNAMGAMLVIGLALVILLVLLLVLSILAKRHTCIERVFSFLKKKLVYNAVLRFILQSTVKFQIAACTVLSYERLTSKEVFKPTATDQIVIASLILSTLSVCSFLFGYILRKNRSKLGQEATKDKFGTLYLGLKPSKEGVVNYSFVFMIRRSFFIAITFALFKQPGLQIQLMIYMTVLYVIYLGYAEFFETKGAKALEIVNESVFILIQY